jgi:ribosomal protein S18 acetylase RimI-like enzyme
MTPALVPFAPHHAAGFRALVADALAEFGFRVDPVLERDLDDPARYYDAVFVAEDGSTVVGSVALRLVEPGVAELKRMYVLPDRRRQGLGRALLARGLEWARDRGVRRIRLDTAEQMTAAQRLYESAGFVRTGRRTEVGASDERCEFLYSLDL